VALLDREGSRTFTPSHATDDSSQRMTVPSASVNPNRLNPSQNRLVLLAPLGMGMRGRMLLPKENPTSS